MALKRHQKFWEEVERKWSENFFQFIERNNDKDWFWHEISSNPNISLKIIEDNPNKPWCYTGISLNPNITMEFIENYPVGLWDWETISANVSLEIIEKYPNKPWDWYGVSSNPSLSLEFIEKNPNKPWDWRNISYNEFSKTRNNFVKVKLEKYLAGVKINNFIFECYFSPHTRVGKKRFKKEYDAIMKSKQKNLYF